MRGLHPGARLTGWFFVLVAIQLLDGWRLLVPFVLLPCFGRAVHVRALSLVRRARWLLLVLAAVLSFGVAGEPLWPAAFAPTVEGVQEAGTHLGRLLLVLFSVAALLESVPLDDLLAGLYWMLGPLRRIGCDTDRAVIRLLLVLRYVETLPRPRDWRVLLDSPSGGLADGNLHIALCDFRAIDYVFVLSLAILAGTFLGWRVFA